MKLKFKSIALALCLGLGTLSASTSDYREIYIQENREFSKSMSDQIKESVLSSSKEVQELYSKIDYKAVWVDREYLTHYAELLIHELKDDFNKGLHLELKETYNKLLPNEKNIFASDSLKHRVEVELGIMQLYVAHINDILKEKKSKHTPLSLLQHALKEESLVHALNAISGHRIEYGMSKVDTNISIIEESEKIDRENITLLNSDNSRERLKAMYEMIHFEPIWVTKAGFSSYTKSLFNQIENDVTFSKDSSAYKNYQNLKEVEVPKDKREIVALEFKLMRLYQDYMSHLLYGSIDWKAFQAKLKHINNADWVVHSVLHSPESLLIEAISTQSLDDAFTKATPSFPVYNKLIEGLKKYENIVSSGGWDILPKFRDLKPNMSDPIIPALRERLTKEGDYVPCENSNDAELYDDCLLEAVKKFQARHGLASEGYIGKMTRNALNESAEEKVARIKLNLDRMKWVKRSSERYQIWVNIPAYTMFVHDGEKQIEKMRVIVGRKGHHTPIFYSRVRTIVLNPYWRIPASIIRHEMIPKLQKNSNYTSSKNIEIHKGYSEHSPKVDPHSVNWHKYGRKLPPYKFMQSPGVNNALGKVKFLFPNKYAVYMHDTNQRNLFSKDTRALSHGCVRLHKPVGLVETFSKIDSKIDFDKAKNTLEHNKKTPIRLSKSIPVDTIYLTTWIDANGEVEFRDDIYGYDKMQLGTE